MKNHEVAKGWVEYHVNGGDDLFHFTEDLLEMVSEDPGRAWEIILIIGSMNDYQDEWLEFIDSSLAAGVLEDLLKSNGAKVVELLEEFPQLLNARLRRQLSLVNHHILGHDIQDSVQRITGID